MKKAAIILTYNESIHIERCIKSLKPFFQEIYVVDSYSSDKTKMIAENLSAIFLENEFVNHSDQFNWALNKIDKNIEWILRIDADEYLTTSLLREIEEKLPKLKPSIKGVFLKRKIVFQGKIIKFGTIKSTKVLRLFRFGFGKSDGRWMDEHIIVKGDVVTFRNKIIDHNLKPISWWISKHNSYANKEVFQIVIDEFLRNKKQTKNYLKSDEKKYIFYKVPIIYRSFLYFIFRYFFCLGFLDGFKGFCFHFMQGFWYRLLVDIKYLEVKNKIKENKLSIKEIIKTYLLIDIDNS